MVQQLPAVAAQVRPTQGAVRRCPCKVKNSYAADDVT